MSRPQRKADCRVLSIYTVYAHFPKILYASLLQRKVLSSDRIEAILDTTLCCVPLVPIRPLGLMHIFRDNISIDQVPHDGATEGLVETLTVRRLELLHSEFCINPSCDKMHLLSLTRVTSTDYFSAGCIKRTILT